MSPLLSDFLVASLDFSCFASSSLVGVGSRKGLRRNHILSFGRAQCWGDWQAFSSTSVEVSIQGDEQDSGLPGRPPVETEVPEDKERAVKLRKQ